MVRHTAYRTLHHMSAASSKSSAQVTPARRHQPHQHQQVHHEAVVPAPCPVPSPRGRQASPAQQERTLSPSASHRATMRCRRHQALTEFCSDSPMLLTNLVCQLRILSLLQCAVSIRPLATSVGVSMVEHCRSRSKVRIIHSNFYRSHGVTGPAMWCASKAGLSVMGRLTRLPKALFSFLPCNAAGQRRGTSTYSSFRNTLII